MLSAWCADCAAAVGPLITAAARSGAYFVHVWAYGNRDMWRARQQRA